MKRGVEGAGTRSGSGRKRWGIESRIGHDSRMPALGRPRRLWDAYRFPGFRPSSTVIGIFGEPHARIITLTRRSKTRPAGRGAGCSSAGTIASVAASAISPVDAAGRLEVYELTRVLRRLEAAFDPDGLSTTARAVLARVRSV